MTFVRKLVFGSKMTLKLVLKLTRLNTGEQTICCTMLVFSLFVLLGWLVSWC